VDKYELLNVLNWENLVTLYEDVAQKDNLVFKSLDPTLSYYSSYYDWPNFVMLKKCEEAVEVILPEIDQKIVSKELPPYILCGHEFYNYHILDDLLDKHGIRQVDQWINICYDMNGPLPQELNPPDFDLREVRNFEDLRNWTNINIALFFHGRPIPSDKFEDNKYTLLNAYEKDTPVGTIMIFWGPNGGAGIYMGGILHEYRSKGYGRKLVTTTLDYIKDRGYKYCFGQATRQGIKQWDKLGFVTTGYLNIYWKVGVKSLGL
jgi:ribosomal protein S18 acetylase RimI-like enzyme